MDHKELTTKHTQVVGHVINNRVKDAFDVLRDLAIRCRNKDLLQQLTDHVEIYRNILKYSFELGDDPE